LVKQIIIYIGSYSVFNVVVLPPGWSHCLLLDGERPAKKYQHTWHTFAGCILEYQRI